MQLIQETENLFRLPQSVLVNCFLVRETDGLTLIDTGLRGFTRRILSAAAELAAPIRRIALTHAHIDHIGSLDALIAALPNAEFSMGARESRLLSKDLSLDPGETGKALIGFTGAKSKPHRLLKDGDRVGSLMAVDSPGHTPGHVAFFDTRDNSLIAGDELTTQVRLVIAGVFKFYFPFPGLFSWNAALALNSAEKLRDLRPSRIASGHGKTIVAPGEALDKAIAEARRQQGK
jgi:glyoxylase-like metal-dependent hydrolase (beta-lactamase superfamily II)